MIDAREILALLDAVPFRPFRVTTSRAAAYVVAAPTDALLTRSTLYVAQDRDAGDGIPRSAAAVALAQIVSADPA